jgi:hypothetical protein
MAQKGRFVQIGVKLEHDNIVKDRYKTVLIFDIMKNA